VTCVTDGCDGKHPAVRRRSAREEVARHLPVGYFKTYFDQRLADLEQAEKVLREVRRGRELS